MIANPKNLNILPVMRHRTLLVIALLASACGTQAADRVALVIGNAGYQNLPKLPACQRDAKLIADIFSTKLGIRIHGGQPLTDLTAGQMDDALHAFAAKLGPETEAYLYFSGHGVQADGVNYLLPVDYSAKYKVQLKRQAISLDDVLAVLEGSKAKLRVIILDSCRSPGEFLPGEPGEKGFSRKGGLVEQKVDNPDTLVCFATKHGTPAFSPDEFSAGTSLYTSVLAQEIVKPGNIEEVLKNVAIGVYAKTEKQQLPFTYGSLLHNFSFLPVGGVPVIARVETKPPLATTTPMIPLTTVQPGTASLKVESTPAGLAFTVLPYTTEIEKLHADLNEKRAEWRQHTTEYAIKGLSAERNKFLKARIGELDGEVKRLQSQLGATPPPLVRTGVTPTALDGLNPGTYRVVVRSEGWPDQKLLTSLNPGVVGQAKAQFIGGSVKVESEPSGATVTMDGRSLGVTPLPLQSLPPGLKSLRVSKDGYSAKTLETTVEAGQIAALSTKLSKMANFDGVWSGKIIGTRDGKINPYEDQTKLSISGDTMQLLNYPKRIGKRSGNTLVFTQVYSITQVNRRDDPYP